MTSTACWRAHIEFGLKVVIDQVYAHTSDAHAWFQESRADRTNPKSDWYVWADPQSRRNATQQLAFGLLWPELDLGWPAPAILHAQFSTRPAQSQCQ